MPNYYNYNRNRGGGNESGPPWIWTILALIFFFPVGLVLLFWKLMGSNGKSNRSRTAGRHPYYTQQGQAAPNPAARPGAKYTQAPPQQTAQPGAQHQQAAQPPRSGQTGGTLPNYHQYSPAAGQTFRPQNKASRRAEKRFGVRAGRGLIVWGCILAGIFGLSTMALAIEGIQYGWWGDQVFGTLFSLMLTGIGGVMASAGILRGKNAKRYRKYLSYIGRRESIPIAAFAQTMGAPYNKVCDDLQDMLDQGILPTGYIDYQRGRLILTDEGIADLEEPVPTPAPAGEKKQEKPTEDELLVEIRRINDLIADRDMSTKIDRIGEITAKILAYQRNNPARAGQLRQFLGYYMPTTLKILRAYAQLEAQGIEGENITAAKARIEGMMDKVVEGFEKQLDRLFQNDAMDITTDVAVLERMIESDGLSGGGTTMQIS